jgi:betaine-aldehyde dehydrogenase
LSALELANICDSIKLPKGVINVVNGDGPSTGSPLVSHPDIDKVSFTGSVKTGKIIAEQSGKDVKNFNLELGGKSPMIVFKDCDFEKTVEWVAFGIFGNKGEVCSATSRLLIEESFYEEFIEKLIQKVKTIKIGNGLSRDVMLGALVSKPQYQRVLNFIEIAKSEGDKLLTGGKKPQESELTPLDGNFLEPTIFLSTKDSTIWKEEVFGPVLSVLTFKSEQEAIELANGTEYGLAAAVMSLDKKKLERIGKKIRSGIVWYNCSQAFFYEAPWGGMKKSGIGRELGKW